MHQPFSRQYRPQTFEAVVGQPATVRTLKNALKFAKIAHAYLFCGSRGTGKTTLARIFAKALNCPNLSEAQEPCNTCPSCLAIQEGRSMDVLEIDGASNRSIDDIRQINETVAYASSSPYKIYLIDEVHMLTKEAFNALLKTLEEPPPNVKFFFATTEPHKVLPTIISRCQRFDLRRLSEEEICQKLHHIAQAANVKVSLEALSLIASLAEGGLRDAESMLDQLSCSIDTAITYESVCQTFGIAPRALFFKLDQAIQTTNLSFAVELTQEVFSSGRELSSFFDGLMEHFRLLLVHKLALPLPLYLSAEEQKMYTDASLAYTEEEVLYNLDYLTQWYKELARIPFKKLFLEMILLHLIRSKNRVSLPSLVSRLVDLEKGGKSAPPTPKKEEAVIVPPAEKVLPPSFQEEVVIAPPVPQPLPPTPVLQKPAAIPPLAENFTLGKASASDLQQVKPVSKEPMSIQMSDAEGCKDEDTGVAKNEVFNQVRHKKARHDTILRFTAVELEGTLKVE